MSEDLIPDFQSIKEKYRINIIVYNTNMDNIEKTAASYLEIAAKGTLEAKTLANDILYLASLRSDKIPALIEAVCEACRNVFPSKNKKEDKDEDIPAKELKKGIIIACFRTAQTFRQKIPHFYFLKKLLNKGLFTLTEIANRMLKFPEKQANQFFSMFLFFSHDLFSKKKTAYDSIMKKFNKLGELESSLQEISSAYEDLIKDDFKRVDYIVENGSDTLSVETALRTDNVEQLKIFMSKKDFDITKMMNKVPFEKNNALQGKQHYIEYAAFYGSLECMKTLISNGSELKKSLLFAIAGGNMECIKFCIEKEAPKSQIFIGVEKYMRFDILEEICKLEGCNIKEQLEGCLFMAAKHCNITGIDFCIKEEVNINAHDIAECNAIDYAVIEGNLDAIIVLVEAGCTTNTCDITGWYPIHFAAKYEHIDILKFLLSLPESNVNVKTGSGKTALHIACENDNAEMIKVLLSVEGIDKNTEDEKGNIPFALINSADVRKETEQLFM